MTHPSSDSMRRRAERTGDKRETFWLSPDSQAQLVQLRMTGLTRAEAVRDALHMLHHERVRARR